MLGVFTSGVRITAQRWPTRKTLAEIRANPGVTGAATFIAAQALWPG
jgi:hypothetical protein